MKTWTIEEIKNLLNTSDKMVAHSVKVLFDLQTTDEQTTGETSHKNGVGFNGVDANFLSSCAQFYIHTGFLTARQTVLCRKKLIKYARQLTLVANKKI